MKTPFNATKTRDYVPGDTSQSFWDRRYAGMTKPSGGRASAVLMQFAADRRPGTALDLGCARGDDAIWLARQGWTVTGVDISQAALDAARQTAERAGVADRTNFVRHDLGESFPDGRFDLVSAMFFQSPVEFARTQALQHAARAVAPGGLLLIAVHGSAPPWSEAHANTLFPTAEEELAALSLAPNEWRELLVGPIARPVTGPDGQQAEIIDAVVALERRSISPR